MTVNEKIFKPSRRPKLFILIILSPLIILLSAVVVADFTVENIIFYAFMIMFFFVLAGIDIFGKHILVKEKVIIQRDYFFRVEQLDIASIRECYIISGMSLRLATDKKYMDINVFYYSESDIRAIAKLVGHPLPDAPVVPKQRIHRKFMKMFSDIVSVFISIFPTCFLYILLPLSFSAAIVRWILRQILTNDFVLRIFSFVINFLAPFVSKEVLKFIFSIAGMLLFVYSTIIIYNLFLYVMDKINRK